MNDIEKKKKFDELFEEHKKFISYTRSVYVQRSKTTHASDDCAQEILLCLWNSINKVKTLNDEEIMKLFKTISFRRISVICRNTNDALTHTVLNIDGVNDEVFDETKESFGSRLNKRHYINQSLFTQDFIHIAEQFHKYLSENHNQIYADVVQAIINPDEQLIDIMLNDQLLWKGRNVGCIRQTHLAEYFEMSNKTMCVHITKIKEICKSWMRKNNLSSETVLN